MTCQSGPMVMRPSKKVCTLPILLGVQTLMPMPSSFPRPRCQAGPLSLSLCVCLSLSLSVCACVCSKELVNTKQEAEKKALDKPRQSSPLGHTNTERGGRWEKEEMKETAPPSRCSAGGRTQCVWKTRPINANDCERGTPKHKPRERDTHTHRGNAGAPPLALSPSHAMP